MHKQIEKLLQENKIKYKILEHRKVYTAFTEAETQHVDPKTVVKTVLVKFSKPTTHITDKGVMTVNLVLVGVPAKKRVDFKKIAKAINEHQQKSFKLMLKENPKLKKPSNIIVKMASEKDIEKKLKTKVGLLTAFSDVYRLPLLLDKKLVANKKLIVSAGSYTESVELSTKNFLKTMSGMVGNFTE